MNGFQARERAPRPASVAPHRAILAQRLQEEHREVGGAFWSELTGHEQAQWYRVARHIEQHLIAPDIARISAP